MKLNLSSAAILTFAILLILAGVLLSGFNQQKTIYIDEDGNNQRVTTRALTVAGAIKSAGIQLADQDKTTPNLNHLLKDGDKILVKRAKRIYILVDGQAHPLITSESKIANVLKQANVNINDGDKLFINAELGEISSILQPGTKTITIQIERAVPINISDGLQTITYKTASSNLLNALWDFGIILETTDLLTQPPETQIKSNLEVGITRGVPIKIKTHAGNYIINSPAKTVGEALTQAGLSLQGLDFSIPNPDAPIPENHEIQLVRIREELIIEHTPIQFETDYQPTDNFELDTRSTIQPGEYGLTAQRVRVHYQDGVEISRIIEDEWVTKEPQSRIIAYGTKIVKKIAETSDGSIEYWRALTMYAVSYRPKETDSTTASGLPLKKGVAAIDRRYIPFYTRMYIPGYGEALAADVGGGVKGRMIDLGYSDEDYVSWHQWVTVYFLWPPPDAIVWFIP